MRQTIANEGNKSANLAAGLDWKEDAALPAQVLREHLKEAGGPWMRASMSSRERHRDGVSRRWASPRFAAGTGIGAASGGFWVTTGVGHGPGGRFFDPGRRRLRAKSGHCKLIEGCL